MWKEIYRIGNDEIDRQHMELFRVTGELLRTVSQRPPDVKERCVDIVKFLKSYVIRHFADEEMIQESVRYTGLAEHKKLHMKFIASVLEHEKKMVESDFSLAAVRDFSGTLAAWLIYHVADEDQKIMKGAALEQQDGPRTLIDILSEHTAGVLCSVAELKENQIKKVSSPSDGIIGDILVTLSLSGFPGTAALVFTRELALKIFEIMTTIAPAEVDDTVCSAIFEIAGIICGKTSAALEREGCSVTPLALSVEAAAFSPQDSVALYTSIGNMGIYVLTA